MWEFNKSTQAKRNAGAANNSCKIAIARQTLTYKSDAYPSKDYAATSRLLSFPTHPPPPPPHSAPKVAPLCFFIASPYEGLFVGSLHILSQGNNVYSSHLLRPSCPSGNRTLSSVLFPSTTAKNCVTKTTPVFRGASSPDKRLGSLLSRLDLRGRLPLTGVEMKVSLFSERRKLRISLVSNNVEVILVN